MQEFYRDDPAKQGGAGGLRTERLIKNITTLKRRADFLAAAKSPFKCVKPCVIVQARSRADDVLSPSAIRVGFTATKKLGNAVVRNRAKRRLRAAVAQVLPEFGRAGCDYVFIGRENTVKGVFADLIRDMKHALKRLADQMTEADQKPEI